jgi:hypothetical protein
MRIQWMAAGFGVGILTLCTRMASAGEALAPIVVPPVHAKLENLPWVDLPEFGGREAIIYRSPDGRRVAAAFHESGKATFTYPFDEFLVVTSGSVTVRVHGGETFTMSAGEVGYFNEGTTVDFDFSADFSDITYLVSDHEVRWR